MTLFGMKAGVGGTAGKTQMGGVVSRRVRQGLALTQGRSDGRGTREGRPPRARCWRVAAVPVQLGASAAQAGVGQEGRRPGRGWRATGRPSEERGEGVSELCAEQGQRS